MKWSDLAELLRLQVMLLASEWKCEAAPKRSDVPEDIEVDCDKWCCNLAEHLGKPLDAPQHLRPWILARLAVAAAQAKVCADGGEPPLPGPDKPEAIVAYLLVIGWHTHLKNLWLSGELSFSA